MFMITKIVALENSCDLKPQIEEHCGGRRRLVPLEVYPRKVFKGVIMPVLRSGYKRSLPGVIPP
jgi:hypothetical protein